MEAHKTTGLTPEERAGVRVMLERMGDELKPNFKTPGGPAYWKTKVNIAIQRVLYWLERQSVENTTGSSGEHVEPDGDDFIGSESDSRVVPEPGERPDGYSRFN